MSDVGAAASGIDPQRVAELLVTPAGSGAERRGTGYRVSAAVVLTAAHVVRDATRVRVRFNADRPGEWITDGEVEWSDAGQEVDAAVVTITPRPGEEATVAPVAFGRLAERDAVVTVRAMGFPWYKLREDPAGPSGAGGGPTVYRDSAHAVGTVALLANRRRGTLEVTVAPPAPDPDPARSPWEGMSGAAVWSGGRVIGLIAEHHPAEGLGRLTAIRVDGWYERLPAERLERLRALVGLPGHKGELTDVVPAPTSELLAASYTAQVRDIAPERLVGREQELADLVGFCAGDEPYRWLCADAWAGKSALAAWFVLHPPDGVAVVSFFVTRRLVGQTDSIAFTEAMVEQLSVVADEPVVGSATPAGRDKERRRLFDLAARRVGERGQRLLLVVDGLDEDEGARPGSGRRSIASLLPERPPESVRVLVTSRPHPGIPIDVPGHHPLRHCPPRPLDDSPAAHDIKVAAKDELVEQLHGDQLQVEILGLITATGGGLTAGELAALTGHPEWLLAGRLGSVFGRSLKTRAPYDQPTVGDAERVYLFAHEELRATAEETLAGDLGPYRLQLDTWADDYRRRGWPEGTPQYLLRSYGLLLATSGNLARLVELATDPRRQDRMQLVTSGDATAIAELTAAQKLALDQPAPDLEVLGRLAVHWDRLAGRNRAIPLKLPALWVRLGQPGRGEALARSIPTVGFRAQRVAEEAVAWADGGQLERAVATGRGILDQRVRATVLGRLAKRFAGVDPARTAALLEEAEQTARAIPYPRIGPLALGAVAEAQAEAGAWELAERTARSIPAMYAAAGAAALRSVTGALAAGGQWERAERTAQAIPHTMVRAEALAILAKAMLGVDRDHAKVLLDTAEGIARGSSLLHSDAGSLSVVVRTVTEVDRDRGLALAGALEQTARRFPTVGRAGALRAVARAMAVIGQWDHALQVARGIPEPYWQAGALGDLAEALAGAGRWDDAERIARGILDPRVRANALVSVAGTLVLPDRDRAVALATEGEQTARQIPWLNAQASVREAVAEAHAAVGRWDRAERTARSIEDAEVQSRALRTLVESLTAARHWDRAERTARGIADAEARAEALGHLAKAVVGVDQGKALALAADAERTAAGVPDLDDQAEGRILRSVTEVLTGAGEWDRAERIATSISDDGERAGALAAVVQGLAGARRWDQAWRVAGGDTGPPAHHEAVGLVVKALAEVDRDRAVALAAETEQAVRDRSGQRPGPLPWELAGLAEVLAAVDRDRAAALAAEAEQAVRVVDDDFERDDALGAVARARVALGHWDQAERHLRAVSDPDYRAEVLCDLAEALTRAGLLDRAERTARTIDDPGFRVSALVAVLAALIGLDPDRARDLAAEAERTARTIAADLDQTEAFQLLVARVTAASGFDAISRDDPLHRRVCRLLAELLAGTAWEKSLRPLARLQPSALDAIDEALRVPAS